MVLPWRVNLASGCKEFWLAQLGWCWWCSHLLCVLWPCHPRECWPICCSKTAKHWKKGLKKLKSKESLIKMLHGWSVFRWIKQLWSFKKNMFSYSALFEFLVMQIWNFCLALALFHLLWINYRAQLVPQLSLGSISLDICMKTLKNTYISFLP